MLRPGFVFEPHRIGDRIKGPRRTFFTQFKVSLIKFIFACWSIRELTVNFPYLQASRLHPFADEYSVTRSFEAYLVWLFGWILFANSQGDVCDKILLSYAREIVDAEDGEVPVYSWGSAVLAATYRSLCDACCRVSDNGVIAGCPIFLQLWAYERFCHGRPSVPLSPYGVELYDQDDETSGPTMGTHWVVGEVQITFVYKCL
jgi:hypothetical protein